MRNPFVSRPSAVPQSPMVSAAVRLARLGLIAAVLAPSSLTAQQPDVPTPASLAAGERAKAAHFSTLAKAGGDNATVLYNLAMARYHECEARRLESDSRVESCSKPTAPSSVSGNSFLNGMAAVTNMFSEREGKKAQEQATRAREAEALGERGMAALRAAQWAEAREAFDGAVRNDPSGRAYHGGLALAQMQLGAPVQAFNTLQQSAVHMAPDVSQKRLMAAVTQQIASTSDASATFEQLGRMGAERYKGGTYVGSMVLTGLAAAGMGVAGVLSADVITNDLVYDPSKRAISQRYTEEQRSELQRVEYIRRGGEGMMLGAAAWALVATVATPTLGPGRLAASDQWIVDAVPGGLRVSYDRGFSNASQSIRRRGWLKGTWLAALAAGGVGYLLSIQEASVER